MVNQYHAQHPVDMCVIGLGDSDLCEGLHLHGLVLVCTVLLTVDEYTACSQAGLRPTPVAAAVQTLHPDAIDVMVWRLACSLTWPGLFCACACSIGC